MNRIAGAIRTHLDGNGRLVRYPAKRKQQIYAAFYLAEKFNTDELYTEKEVNALLEEWHVFHDPCTLRRDLCDLGFLGRERDGSRYWIEKTQPTPELLLIV